MCIWKAILTGLFIAVVSGQPESTSYRTFDLETTCGKGRTYFSLDATGPASASILRATSRLSYSLQLHCEVQLIAPPGYHVMVSFRMIDFRINFDGSCKDYIQVQGSTMCRKFLRLDEETHEDSLYNHPSNIMNLIYHIEPAGLNNRSLSGFTGFELIFTAFSTVVEKDTNNTVYKCANGNRIWSGLTCDGHNNCGDLSDEGSRCGSSGGGSTALIILGILILSMLFIMCVATLLSRNERVRSFSTRIRQRTVSFMQRNRTSV